MDLRLRPHDGLDGPGPGGGRLTYAILFTVRKPYFDAIVAGVKTSEVRRKTERWSTVLQHALVSREFGEPVVAVFQCGRQIHRRLVVDYRVAERAYLALGREPSPQGRQDVGDGPVIAFKLGRVVREG